MTIEERRAYMKDYRARAGWRARRKKYMRRWYALHPGRTTEYARRWHRKQPKGWKYKRLRAKFFAMYGDICKCGFSDKRALQLDHVKGNGSRHRKQKRNGLYVYRDATKKYQPDKYQTLCANCNWIKRDVDVLMRLV